MIVEAVSKKLEKKTKEAQKMWLMMIIFYHVLYI